MSDLERYSPTNTKATMQWSEAMSNGDLLPAQYRGKPANLMFAAEYADSLGISRIHVLTSIAVINGRPSPSADLMAAMVRSHGHKLRVYGDDTTATAELIRSDDPDFTFTAHWDEAKARKAGLWGNRGPWTQYPAAMLRARAISEVVRMGAQDVMAGGIYTPEELGATVDADGVPVQSERVEQPATVSRTRPQGARSNRDAAMQALQQQEASPAEDADSLLAEADLAAGDRDALLALYKRAENLPTPDEVESVQAVIKALGDDLKRDQQPATDAPVDAEIVDEDAA